MRCFYLLVVLLLRCKKQSKICELDINMQYSIFGYVQDIYDMTNARIQNCGALFAHESDASVLCVVLLSLLCRAACMLMRNS